MQTNFCLLPSLVSRLLFGCIMYEKQRESLGSLMMCTMMHCVFLIINLLLQGPYSALNSCCCGCCRTILTTDWLFPCSLARLQAVASTKGFYTVLFHSISTREISPCQHSQCRHPLLHFASSVALHVTAHHAKFLHCMMTCVW